MYFLPREVRSKGKLSPPWKFRTASAASFPLRPHFRWQRNHLLTTRNRRSVHYVLRAFPTAFCLTTRPWSRRFVHRSLERSFAANFDARWLMSSLPIDLRIPLLTNIDNNIWFNLMKLQYYYGFKRQLNIALPGYPRTPTSASAEHPSSVRRNHSFPVSHPTAAVKPSGLTQMQRGRSSSSFLASFARLHLCIFWYFLSFVQVFWILSTPGVPTSCFFLQFVVWIMQEVYQIKLTPNSEYKERNKVNQSELAYACTMCPPE